MKKIKPYAKQIQSSVNSSNWRRVISELKDLIREVRRAHDKTVLCIVSYDEEGFGYESVGFVNIDDISNGLYFLIKREINSISDGYVELMPRSKFLSLLDKDVKFGALPGSVRFGAAYGNEAKKKHIRILEAILPDLAVNRMERKRDSSNLSMLISENGIFLGLYFYFRCYRFRPDEVSDSDSDSDYDGYISDGLGEKIYIGSGPEKDPEDERARQERMKQLARENNVDEAEASRFYADYFKNKDYYNDEKYYYDDPADGDGDTNEVDVGDDGSSNEDDDDDETEEEAVDAESNVAKTEGVENKSHDA